MSDTGAVLIEIPFPPPSHNLEVGEETPSSAPAPEEGTGPDDNQGT